MLTGTTGRIFNIVHGSFVDGWGIRTTVLLKGCPLRCRWCCNPESQSIEPEPQVISEHCTSCGKCVPVCPAGALALRGGKPEIDRKRCTACGVCTDVCWPGALNIWGAERTAEDVFAECLRDRSFYERSGGGVTLSGGEPTMQPDFCLEILERCHNASISVAVDTCGYVTTKKGREVLQRADLLLFDVKGLDPHRHKTNTGRSNDIILDNLLHMNALGKSIIVRCPVIPGCNDMESKAIAEFLSTLTCVRRVDLIGYHNYGSGKYAELGRVYPMEGTPPMDESAKQALLNIFLSYGLNAQLGG